MRKGLIASVFVLMIAAAFWMSVPVGCANMIPPSGGPRDTIPPVLIAANPRDSSVNFKGDRIVLTFNEDLDDPREPNTILYTPSFEVPPTITTKGRVLTVKFNDTLQRNTTYVINFANSIVDITEGNPVKNYVYAFSTGSYLDSLEISGRVLLAENGEVDSTLIVVLHKDLRDSAVRIKTPQYVTRLDRNGYFHFHYLPKDTFAIYAIGDAAISRRYQTPTQLFAFNNTPVVAGKADSVVLYAFREASQNASNTAVTGTSQKIPASDRRLRFTPGTTAQQELLNDFVLTFPVPLKNFDSTKLHLTTDSVFTPVAFSASMDTSDKEVRIKTQWKEGAPYHLILEKDFATDTAGRQLLKSDTLSFVTKKTEDYGSLALRIKGIDSLKNPMLQLVQNNQVILTVPIKSGIYNQALFVPGEYSLRVFDDVNGNGKWDAGKFFGEKKQPEIVHQIQRTITIKPNWDNEFDVVL